MVTLRNNDLYLVVTDQEIQLYGPRGGLRRLCLQRLKISACTSSVTLANIFERETMPFIGLVRSLPDQVNTLEVFKLNIDDSLVQLVPV